MDLGLMIESYKSSGSRWTLRCAVVACLLLLRAAANAQQELIIRQPIAREMRGGEKHTYQVKLNAGQYARFIVEQKGIDVVLGLSGADGKPILEVDNNLSGTRGMEVVSVVADVSGVYQLNV